MKRMKTKHKQLHGTKGVQIRCFNDIFQFNGSIIAKMVSWFLKKKKKVVSW